jgi:hypothetical protein
MLAIPTLGMKRQENHEFKPILGYIARLCLKKTKRKKRICSLSIIPHVQLKFKNH